MADVAVVVSACRGIGTGSGVLLSDDDWRTLKSELIERVERHCGTLVSYNEGTWYHEGGHEPQVVLVAGDVPKDWHGFRTDIGDVAERWAQDSIAVTVGVPVFIGPDGREV